MNGNRTQQPYDTIPTFKSSELSVFVEDVQTPGRPGHAPRLSSTNRRFRRGASRRLGGATLVSQHYIMLLMYIFGFGSMISQRALQRANDLHRVGNMTRRLSKYNIRPCLLILVV